MDFKMPELHCNLISLKFWLSFVVEQIGPDCPILPIFKEPNMNPIPLA